MAEKLGKLLDGANDAEKAEILGILGELSGGMGSGSAHSGPDVVPEYSTYYNQTDEKITDLLNEAVDGELDRWFGIVSHLNATTLLTTPRERAELQNEIEIAYWEDTLTIKNEHNKKILRGLRYWCTVRLYDAMNGHRANMIKEKVVKSVHELQPQAQRARRFGL